MLPRFCRSRTTKGAMPPVDKGMTNLHVIHQQAIEQIGISVAKIR